MYQYSIRTAQGQTEHYIFPTYEQLLEHYNTFIKDLPWCTVLGHISRSKCKLG